LLSLDLWQQQLAFCRDRLSMITDAINLEVGRPFPERRWQVLSLLYRERAVYSFAVSILMELETSEPEQTRSAEGTETRA
jgi:hypothetical protein